MTLPLTEQELANAVYYEGSYVDRDVLGVIQKIADYDPNLRVQYLEIAATLDEAPWRVVERCKDGQDRVVLTAWVMDNSVYDRLILADTQLWNPSEKSIQNNQKIKQNKHKKDKEEMAESSELAGRIIYNDKSYSFIDDKTDEKVTIRTDGTVKRESRGYKNPSSV